jgi:DNA-binding response OmpR family regulator
MCDTPTVRFSLACPDYSSPGRHRRLRRVSDSEGFRASEANDSDDGVAKALELMPDFIVLDFDLDGETTARLKAHISTRGIPVIALTKMDEVRTRGSVPNGT